MHKILISLFVMLVMFGCNSDDDISGCGLDNPKEELAWLKSIINDMESNPTVDTKYCYVVQATYKNRTVFKVEDCNPVISKVVFTLNCDGNRVDSNDDPLFSEDLKNRRIIWKPFDFGCPVEF